MACFGSFYDLFKPTKQDKKTGNCTEIDLCLYVFVCQHANGEAKMLDILSIVPAKYQHVSMLARNSFTEQVECL